MVTKLVLTLSHLNADEEQEFSLKIISSSLQTMQLNNLRKLIRNIIAHMRNTYIANYLRPGIISVDKI